MTQVFQLDRESWKRAGPDDLIEMKASSDKCDSHYREKWLVATLGYSIARRLPCHLSGPTAAGKTSFIEALAADRNFERLCECLGLEPLPLELLSIEPISFESAAEVRSRRALGVRDGASVTFDEWSSLLESMLEGAQREGEAYPVIFLREVGRCHAQVQSGLLNCMSDPFVRLPDGTEVPNRVSWLCDSNYLGVEEGTGNYVLSTFDSAFKRRWLVNLSIQPLTAENEALALERSLRGVSR